MNPGVNKSQALNIWIIQIVVAIGPPLGGLAFTIYMKTDWGISLFPDTAGAGRDSLATPAKDGVVSYLRDLVRYHAYGPRCLPLHRRARDSGQSQRGARLWRAFDLARELTQDWHTHSSRDGPWSPVPPKSASR